MGELSQMQRSIVKSDARVCMVIAGPGSGKTRVLVHRVADQLSKGIPEDSILLLTFTNKAAKNMIDRIEHILNRKTKIVGGTFHHVANRFLRENVSMFGYKSNYSIIDDKDSIALIRRVIKTDFSEHADDIPRPEIVHKIISYCKNSMTSISSYLETNFKGYKQHSMLINKIWDAYDKRKKRSNVMDFDDLLTYFYRLLDNDEFRVAFQSKFTHIFIDEFQDTNQLQFKIVSKMHRNGNSLFVVGDDCQSIYAFRAAEIRNLLSFMDVFPEAKKFYLTENFRSAPGIVDLVNAVIENNKNKFDKKLVSVKPDSVKVLPTLHIFDDSKDEARHIAESIANNLDEGTSPSEIAVLYRSNFQSAYLELELSKHGVKYIKLGGRKFFEQSHIKDIISFLKISNGMTDEIAWIRILKLFEGIGDKTAMQIFSCVSTSDNPLIEFNRCGNKRLDVLRSLLACVLDASPKEKVTRFLDMFYAMYIKTRYENHEERMLDIDQLISILSSYDSVDSFLEDALLDANLIDKDDIGDRVVISTVHQAKGLEWSYVYLIGLAQGKFPSKHAIGNDERIEEERRLFYVACSRAKRFLELCVPLEDNLSFDDSKCMDISQFISELPENLYEHHNHPRKVSKMYGFEFVSADNLL